MQHSLKIIFRSKRGGFTLVEMLVVVFIIALLAALAVPVVSTARKKARQARLASDIQVIGTALEQYKIDHGDYPRVSDNLAATPANAAFLNGAQVLCRALIAPGPGFRAGTTETVNDGAGASTDPQLAGQGFRIRSATQGRVYGPYLKADQFTLGNPVGITATTVDPLNYNLVILDDMGNPFLYFPARLGKTNIATGGLYVAYGETNDPLFDRSDCALDDGTTSFHRLGETGNEPRDRFHWMLGDYNSNGTIELTAPVPEIQKATKPYLLWSAGVDGLYGPNAGDEGDGSILERFDVDVCDDATNFQL